MKRNRFLTIIFWDAAVFASEQTRKSTSKDRPDTDEPETVELT